ncbi:MAG: zinc chelation protein SecC [Gammaproteobacteria bacterium]|nr:MAG: zinc chelation protein SecC [Gammaproteobacteria bacterium]
MLDGVCFCGSGVAYAGCCGRFHNGAIPATAEELMRSRYSAFCCKDADYLIATIHADYCSSNLKEELVSNFNDVSWIQLKVIYTNKGSKSDIEGDVEFEAIYFTGGQFFRMVERSDFVKEGGRWLYCSGRVDDRKISKNEICFCGSGLKFKRCHGAV